MSSHLVWLESRHPEKADLAASGCQRELVVNAGDESALQKLHDFVSTAGDWIFGFISYDLKNHIEALQSSPPDRLNAPLVHLFVPENVCRIMGGKSEVLKGEHIEIPFAPAVQHKPISLLPRTSKERYLEKVRSLQHHIRQGNIYEVNYCMEFYGHAPELDTLSTYRKLAALACAPFSAFVQLGNIALMCASPERFLRRQGDVVISQPIKGTAPRGTGAAEDQRLKAALAADEKERSENVMIVDLVRNDLARSALKGTVKVDELCGVHTFNTVHQLISTVSCLVAPHTTFSELLAHTFPMGSMTGAPKISAMKLIDTHEDQARGLYSGTVGYITPQGDFDFNVVIRSLIHNRHTGYLSAMAGSAITHRSRPESEFEECLLKVQALMKALQ